MRLTKWDARFPLLAAGQVTPSGSLESLRLCASECSTERLGFQGKCASEHTATGKRGMLSPLHHTALLPASSPPASPAGHAEEGSSPPHPQRAEGFPGERADQVLHVRWPNHCEGGPPPAPPLPGTAAVLPSPFFPCLLLPCTSTCELPPRNSEALWHPRAMRAAPSTSWLPSAGPHPAPGCWEEAALGRVLPSPRP